MDRLINILRAASGQLEEGWLYLPEAETWSFATLGMIIDVDKLDIAEVNEEDEPLVAKEKGLISTLDSSTIESIFSFTENLDFEMTDDLLLESFLYYYDYDAFLPHPGFKPLLPEKHLRKMDRDFFDSLGQERSDVLCKNDECQKGAITGSAFCKIHQFEMIQNKRCPFTE